MREGQKEMEEWLRYAAATDNIQALYAILDQDPLILKRMIEKPVTNTPLHEAAAKGNTSFATELTILQPLLAQKLNLCGLSPMHVALQAKHFETARALMILDPELIRVKGSGGFTALHHVASVKGDTELDLLAEFLCMCGSSIDDVTCRGETAVHVAVKNDNPEAFKILFGWLKRVYLLDVLDMKDVDGNTVLHIAASTNQQEVVQLLVKETTLFGIIRTSNVKVNAVNFENMTALDVFEQQTSPNQEVRKILRRARAKKASANTNVMTLSKFLKRNLTPFERFSRYFGIRDESTRNMILMVATLIATATYQAALSPPGGYWQDDAPSSSSSIQNHKAGDMVMSGSKLYRFMLLNGSAFLASIGTIWATAIGLYPDTLIVYLSITILAVTYFGSINSGFPSSHYAGSVLSFLYMYGFLVVLFIPIMFYIWYWRVVSGVDATKRWVAYIRGLKVQK